MHSKDMIGWSNTLLLVAVLTLGCGKKENPPETVERILKTTTRADNSQNGIEQEVSPEVDLRNIKVKLPSLRDFAYKKSAKGIITGTVVICGNLIPSPYQIKYDDNLGKTFINGIEVCPGRTLMRQCGQAVNYKDVDINNERKANRERMRSTIEYKTKCDREMEVLKYGKDHFKLMLKKLGVTCDPRTREPNSWKLVCLAADKTKSELESKWPDIISNVSYLRCDSSGRIAVHFRRDDLPLCDQYNAIADFTDLFTQPGTVLGSRVTLGQERSRKLSAEERRKETEAGMDLQRIIQSGGSPACRSTTDVIRRHLSDDHVFIMSDFQNQGQFILTDKAKELFDVLNTNVSFQKKMTMIETSKSLSQLGLSRKALKLLFLALQ